ncbi:FAD/NAD(P)-binding domain-containing protein [Aureobasidium pullulans]|uniref:FAD/NAD(P)-binding domain-containing protein n=1 Tax=Aureobasidium pullulans TaxID=5580 RepID=A0AB74J5P3_AURPU|nr:FAD/NAD(P)-binding domain-containing protein [Aureobasidium pullulans]
MRYSIAALSLVSPALALPTLSLLGGGLFGGHHLLGGLLPHGHGGGSSYANTPSHNNGPDSYGARSTPAGESSSYGSGSVSNGQGSSYQGATSGESAVSSSVVDAASASQETATHSGSGSVPYANGPASHSVFSSSTSLTSSSTLTPIVPAATTSPYEGQSSESGQTCESPSIIGCETASDSSATEVSPDSVGIYDVVIVGGGTAGLVIANRLSENSYTTVAVIEAGDLVFDNKNVSTVDGYGLSFGTEIDWQYESTPQAYAGNKTQTLRAGKALGGTSTINGMAYLRAQEAQINSWEHLGNEGWNWKSLLPYYKRSEHFQIPTEDQCIAGASYDISVHGTTGPLKTGWNTGLLSKSVTTLVNATYASLGLPYIEEPNGGDMRGFTRYPATVDRELNVREDAGRAYYLPIQNRTNLDLYTNSFVQRITWDETSTNSTPRANGVQFTDASGKQKTISAKKEVILSAGSLRSPLILELSGIGNPAILEQHGIDVKVDLPFVGENLQDQTTGAGAYSSNTNFSGTADYVGYFNVADIFGNGTYDLNCTVRDSLLQYATSVVEASGGIIDQKVMEKLFMIHYDLIFKDQIPISEILISPGEDQMAFSYWGLLPFSRGSVHIQSNDSTIPAAINPNYFQLDYDLKQQIGTAKAVRKLAGSEALCDIVTGELSPGLQSVPLNASDEVWAKAVKEGYRSNYHYIATAAMMAQDLGGVVNTDLLVYGVDNVRVVDASVIPFQVCGHLTATIYAIAEKAADAIKSRYY